MLTGVGEFGTERLKLEAEVDAATRAVGVTASSTLGPHVRIAQYGAEHSSSAVRAGDMIGGDARRRS
jgi:hypothetical protein